MVVTDFEHAQLFPRPSTANEYYEGAVLTAYGGRGYSDNGEALVSTDTVSTDTIETVSVSRGDLRRSSQRTHGLYTHKAAEGVAVLFFHAFLPYTANAEAPLFMCNLHSYCSQPADPLAWLMGVCTH